MNQMEAETLVLDLSFSCLAYFVWYVRVDIEQVAKRYPNPPVCIHLSIFLDNLTNLSHLFGYMLG